MENEKIAITAEKDTIESLIDQRFGRCKYFLIVELKNNEIKEVKAVENEGALQGHGAGIKAGQQVGDFGVKAVITGNLGPNATNVLNQLGIKAYQASGTAEDAVEQFIKGKLSEITQTAPQHSGIQQPEQSKGERIFFPLLDDNGEDSEISEHFGHAPFFGIYNVEKKELKITKNDLDHTDPTKSPIDQIEEAVNPTTIFAKSIGGRAIDIISQKGLFLKTGNYSKVRDAIDNINKLEDLTNSCGH